MVFRAFFKVLLIAGVFLGAALQVDARVEVRVADEEKPVFAFFKLAQYAPDFQYWAENMVPGLDIDTEEKLRLFIEHEATRLQWAFGTYDETEEFLPLRIPVDLEMRAVDGKRVIHYTLVGFEGEEFPFFPFPYGGQAIGLILKDLARFNDVELPPADAERIAQHFNGGEPLRASLRMRVRPLEAEVSAPSVVEGVNFWMLSGDVGYFSYELKKPQGGYERLMSYSAPWFMTPSELELFELLGQ